MIGLGKMGANMVKRLMAGGHSCVGFDVNSASVESLKKEGAQGATSLEELVAILQPPRIIWCMVITMSSPLIRWISGPRLPSNPV